MKLNKFTRNLMDKFPSWMRMSKDPSSIGAQFLDVFGVTFEDFQTEFDEAINNFYITTANTEVIDWIYKIPLITERVVDDSGTLDIQEVSITTHEKLVTNVHRAKHVQNFYHRETKLPSYWLDRANEVLYLRINLDDIADLDNPFISININGTPHYNLILHHVWNLFDEFGLLVGLQRLYKETNLFYKERILDVFRRPGNSSRDGIIAGLERELDLPPNSINIKNLDNVEEDDSLTYPDGSPTRKLMKYAKQVNETLKYSWGELNLDEAYWFSISQDDIAIEYLPHIWDIDMSGFEKKDYQSGVGYGDDLLIHKPKEEDRHRSVKVSVGLMGYIEEYEEVYPELTFQYRIYAKGQILEKDYMPQDFKYTIQSTETFNQAYRIHATSDIYNNYNIPIDSVNKIAKNTASPNINFGKSTDILHDQTHEMVKLVVRPKRFSETESPNMKQLDLIWEDTQGQEHTYSFKTEEDFFIDKFNTAGNPMTNVLTSSVAYNTTRGLELGRGNFHEEIDTTEELRTGTWDTNNILIENGTLQLNLEGLFGKEHFGPK